ncbi:DUF58 domain-containing protein [Actinomyces sp. 2119]|uniref:DUF58 domain-containing protein n=1 Tax=Actinomyces sp. 2119 TaxID=2321393 RepID=UPI000E6BBD92|nr:DUF58 domain-containing protein [Actinomyces sp. 2119]RJF41497.1 DUF58 domain-containing protein [Actinomyces sp. 2119]
MFLTMRTLWAMVPSIVVVVLLPRPALLAAWTGVVTLLVAADVAATPSTRHLSAQRRTARAIRLGASTTSTVTVTNSGPRAVTLSLRDAWPPSAGASKEYGDLTVPAGQHRQHVTTLTPWRRGYRQAGPLTVRSTGPLGLAGRQTSLQAEATLRVLPAFSSRRHLASRQARLREMDGRSAVITRGEGTEFDSLRGYVVGDDARSIDWRSSARRSEVVVRTWRPERDRRVLVLLSTGRTSAVRLGDEPRLDLQIEAALLLAALASHAGDRVEVAALDSAVRLQVRGESGPALMSTLANGLAPVEARLVEPNWPLMASVARSSLSQRALVVVLAALDGAGADAGMLQALSALAHQHTVVLASATDPSLEKLRARRDDTEAVYTASAAEMDLIEHDAVRRYLHRAGVVVVEASGSRLAPDLADTYLDLKIAGRL